MKQTAVEWFYIEMENLRVKAEITNMDGNDFIIAKVKLLQQAKAMEKEQKIEFAFDFYYDFSNQLGVPFNLISENRTNAEKYYEQKFKSDKDFSCVQFILDNKTSSATKCICGREKWQHTTFKSE